MWPGSLVEPLDRGRECCSTLRSDRGSRLLSETPLTATFARREAGLTRSPSFEEPQVTLNDDICRVLLGSLKQQGASLSQVAFQHIVVAKIVENSRGAALHRQHAIIGPLCKIEPAQPVVGRGKAEPGFRAFWIGFHRLAEMPLS